MAEERLAGFEAALRVGRGVVLQTYPNLDVLQCLSALVGEVVSAGGNVVVLGDARSDREIEALRVEYPAFLEQAHLANPFHFGTAYIGTVSDFITVLRDPDHADWVNRVGLILVPRGEQILARPYVWELMAFTVRDRFYGRDSSKSPRTVVVLEPRHAALSAIRDALPLYASDPNEARGPWSGTSANPHTADQLWWTLWTTETSFGYFQNLEQINNRHYAGVAPPLAQFAGRWGVALKDNWLLYTPDSGDLDHAENLERSLGRRLFNAIADQPWASLHESAAHVGGVTAAEDQGNPWRSLHRTAHRFTGTALCNLIVRSSMLTSYQIANAGHFSSSPLLPISPLVSREVPFDTAIQVIQRLFVMGPLRLSSVRDALAATERHKDDADPALVNPFEALVALVRRELGAELAAQLRCETRTEWQPERDPGRFEEVGYVCMDAGDIARAPIDWLDEFLVVDEAGAIYDRLHREHVSQEYWPRKVVLLEGNKFTVDKVDTDTRRVQVTQDEAELPDYRPERVVTINQPTSDWIPLRETQPVLTSQGDGLVIEAFRLDFSVSCGRAVASLDHWASPPQVQSFPLQDRRFRSGRAARIRLLDRDGNSLLTGSTAVALATWLNEAIPTVMPEASRFFIAAPEVDVESRPRDQSAQLVVPLLRIERYAEALPAVWVFEDSQSDLGVIRAVSDRLRYLLDLCFDWLRWRFDESRDPDAGGVCLVNSQSIGRDWFAFGCKAIDPVFGLEDLKTSLARYQELFRWFTPRQRTARGASLLGDSASAEIKACDICATTITAGAPCDVLVDGRMSCRACTEVGVTSVAVLERLYREVARPFYLEVLGEVEIANVRVELVDQNDISLAQGKSFIPTSAFDMRAIGLAIPGGSRARSGTREEGGRYLVQIESGFSPEDTACTLVHELCHVWQFDSLDIERLTASHGYELIEGHAVWTEDAFVNWQRARFHPILDEERWTSIRAGLDTVKTSFGLYGNGYRYIHSLVRSESAFDWLRRYYTRIES